jgi:hypothetical protein
MMILFQIVLFQIVLFQIVLFQIVLLAGSLRVRPDTLDIDLLASRVLWLSIAESLFTWLAC